MEGDSNQISAPLYKLSDKRIIWFFGLSGSGKTTLASQVFDHYKRLGIPCLWLDGDRVREGLSSGLGFSKEDRLEHHRRIAEVAKIASEQGFTVVVSAIAPLVSIRSRVNDLLGNTITWIFLEPGESICKSRDTKGLYSSVSRNQFTQLFESPLNKSVHLHLNTGAYGVEHCVKKVLDLLNAKEPFEHATFNI